MSNSVNLSLDVTKTGIQNPLIKVRQGDGGFETLHTTVTSNGEPLDLQGWTITFMGTTAGNHKVIDANVKVVEAPNGIFDYTPSKAWGMDIGDFKMAYFKFVKGDGSASSANFRVNVIEAVDLTQEEAKNYISVVDATIAEAKQHLTDSLASITASVAANSSAVSSLAISASSVATSAINKVNTTASSAVSQVNSAAGIYVKKSGDTMTGALTVGGDPTQGGSGTTIQQNGNIELGASTAFIDFHGKNSTQDYTSRIYDDTTFAGAKVNNANGGNSASAWLNTLVLSSTRSFNLDTLTLTVDGVNYALTYNEFTIAWGSSSQVTVPTLPAGMTNFNIDNGAITYRIGPNIGWVYMEMTDFSSNTTWKRTKRGGVWQPWSKIASDANVVHNTGTETIAGDKTFTGNTTANNLVSNGVPVNAVKTTTSTMWYNSTLTAYRNGNVVTIVNNKQDTSTIYDTTLSTETIPLGYRPATTVFYPAVYGSSFKGEIQINSNGTFTARGAINGQYRLTATYVTSDAWPV